MRPGINPRSRPRPNRKARRRHVQWSPGRIEYINNLMALRKMVQEDKKRMKAQVNGWRKAFSRLDKMKSLRMTDGPLYPVDYPPNDWMCGFAPNGRSFSPSMKPEPIPRLVKSNISLGLGMLDVFMIQDPAYYRPSVQEKLLEEEARRHFPLADAASQAAYVDHSLKMIEAGAAERSLYTRQTILFNEILEKSKEKATIDPVIRVSDAETGQIYFVSRPEYYHYTDGDHKLPLLNEFLNETPTDNL